jgi:Cytochrome bd-type quinol oxidase, subunit 2
MSLADAIALFMLMALVAYCLSGGADFGGGLWDLLAFGNEAPRQRRLIANALSPIWEANHVWLIILVTLLFICFPKAFVTISIALHLPLTLMLIGIVLRGAAFTFRSYGKAESSRARHWEVIFAVASILTPIMLGIVLASLATGRVRAPLAAASFAQNYVWPWLAPFPIAIGVFALSLFALLAAVYLTVEAKDRSLREVFRRKALAAAFIVALLALGSYFLSAQVAPRIERGLSDRWWSLPLQATTGLAALVTIAALWRRCFSIARVAAVVQVALIVSGWAFSQYPYLIVPNLTLAAAAAPRQMLRPILAALLLGTAVLIPSFLYLYRIFKGEKAPEVKI